MRQRRLFQLAPVAITAVLGGPAPAGAQLAEMRAAAAILPDTVHVGQPFRIGVQVRTPAGVKISFPSVLETTEDLEQVAEADIGRRRARSGVSRAYYRMVAWSAGDHQVPAIPVEVVPSDGGEPFEILVQVPPLTVETVLPADIEGLELRQALPFLNPLPFPWLILLVLAALLAGVWAYRQYRKKEAEPDETMRQLSPWERAQEELRMLVEEWRGGRLAHDAFCDRLEGILKGYLFATEAWAPGVPVRAVVNGNRRLAHALDYSARVRFARLVSGYGGPIEAADTCRGWIAERHQPDGEEAP